LSCAWTARKLARAVRSEPLPAIEPMPPSAAGVLPWVGAGLGLLRDPTAFFTKARRRLGDTFVTDAFGYRLLCVFSPEGVRALYSLPSAWRARASPTTCCLRHKIPTSCSRGGATSLTTCSAARMVETYLEIWRRRYDCSSMSSATAAVSRSFSTRAGSDIAWVWPLGRAWNARRPSGLDRLIPQLDRLGRLGLFRGGHGPPFGPGPPTSGASAGQCAPSKRSSAKSSRAATAAPPTRDFLARIIESWSDAPPAERETGVARDVMLIHMGSQSNLFAAMGWTVRQPSPSPRPASRVSEGDDELLEKCANESIRMAQRSITLRRVLAGNHGDDGSRSYRVAPDAFIATMLSATNTTSAPGLDRFDPSATTAAACATWPGSRRASW
jgi:hypothetical protein